MSDPYLGEIRLFPYAYAPQGWALCNGQSLSIAQYTALYSLIGTAYGGDGVTHFALPDLQGRAAVSAGQGRGLSPYKLGQAGGNETVALTENQMPPHAHAVIGDYQDAESNSPAGMVPAAGAHGSYGQNANTPMGAGMIRPTGGGQPHENRPPFLTLNYCIALQGIYPPRP